jgi:sulfate transport system ATP-binding protein
VRRAGADRAGDGSGHANVSTQGASSLMGITVLEVTKKFGDFVALDDVSVAIPEGSLTALLGPSGSGKSTLLRVIAGLEEPDGGQVLLGDDDVTHQPARARGVGMVFQHYAAFKHMTVWENVAFGLKVRKRPKPEIESRVHELLELVQLEGLAKRYPAQLSGGQRQRMALARALAVDPEVLLLDEPFGALDARVRKELRAWLRRLHDEVHVTTIIVTHDQEEAMEVAGQIVVINHGRVEQVGTPRELYESPANEFVMSFVGPVNKIGDTFVRPRDISISLEPDGESTEAMVERVVHLGFEVRAELVRDDGQHLLAQLTQEEAQALELERGVIVYAKPNRQTIFTC